MTGIIRVQPILRLGCALVLTWATTVCALAQTPPRTDPKPKDKDLAKRLMRKAVAFDEEDVMEAVIRLMKQAVRKLEIEFDAGDDTQAVQRHITSRLDEAIKIAAAQRRPTRSRGKSAIGDKRHMPAGPKGQGQPESEEVEPEVRAEVAPEAGAAAVGVEVQEPAATNPARARWRRCPLKNVPVHVV